MIFFQLIKKKLGQCVTCNSIRMIKEDFLAFFKQTVGFSLFLFAFFLVGGGSGHTGYGSLHPRVRSNCIFGTQPSCHTFLSLIFEEKNINKQLYKMTA